MLYDLLGWMNLEPKYRASLCCSCLYQSPPVIHHLDVLPFDSKTRDTATMVEVRSTPACDSQLVIMSLLTLGADLSQRKETPLRCKIISLQLEAILSGTFVQLTRIPRTIINYNRY